MLRKVSLEHYYKDYVCLCPACHLLLAALLAAPSCSCLHYLLHMSLILLNLSTFQICYELNSDNIFFIILARSITK